MKKASIKHYAQKELCSALQVAFHNVSEETSDYSQADREAILDEMSKQFARIEKLFGYVPRSWHRGV